MIEMRVSSIQRRTERFFILTYYKLANGLMKGSGCYKTKDTRHGRVAICPSIPPRVKPWIATLRRDSFGYRAALLYNSCPTFVRNISGEPLSKFKRALNRYLSSVPDRPRDITGCFYPDPYDSVAQTPSNSLLHWGVLLRGQRPDWGW